MSHTATDSLRAALAELVGTAFLLMAVVGSGIMGERLAGGNTAIALLANAIATGTALVALILTFAPISGAHFNPAVSLMDRRLSWGTATDYVVAQILGAFLGVLVAHLMFGVPVLEVSGHPRNGWPQGLSEAIATFGLLTVIRASRPETSAIAVGAYITAAYWFTSSTSFANPAVTLARTMTDTFAGIRPADAPMFLLAQGVGALAARIFGDWVSR
jgi:glycerol uptake facilitator-like aquaporin